jgi:frataxin-like iron-binding protein CyaY
MLDKGALNKNYFVVLSDSDKLRKGKNDLEKHKVKVISSFQIQELRKKILELELQDGGVLIQSNKKPAKLPIWLYIIAKVKG